MWGWKERISVIRRSAREANASWASDSQVPPRAWFQGGRGWFQRGRGSCRAWGLKARQEPRPPYKALSRGRQKNLLFIYRNTVSNTFQQKAKASCIPPTP